MTKAIDAIVGESRAIVDLRELIRTVAPTKLSVFIEGPTGAGKELVAAAIHEESRRRGSFVPFNICAIGDSMFEDALFGHVRGAFTGAAGDMLGFLREANGGTAFFDEVSGLQPLLQTKLLRAIEFGGFRPVGASRDAQSDFRVVAATNEKVEMLVANGQLRADLAHRLSGVVVTVPPLCDRPEDVPMLAQHFLARAGVAAPMDRGVVEVLSGYSWPGNVRELRNVVERVAVLGGLTVHTVAQALSNRREDGVARMVSRRNKLRATLEAHRWNADAAARELGVHRTTLYRWMKEVQLVAAR